MVSELGESTSTASQNPSCSSDGSNSNDTGDFECNICLDLAQDPIVTLCGHLFCWPCLYRWLHHHSYSQECPVCKALIQEEKLVPLYGRGKKREDPRSKPLPDMRIPNRPTGQRPETAEPPNANQYMPAGFDGMTGGGFAGGYVPAPTARLGNIALFTAFGGLFPSLFNIQIHSIPTATVYGTPSAGYPYPFPNIFHGGHGHGFAQTATRAPLGHDNLLKNLLFIIGFFVILAVICY
uniref:E3 ubiquitin-protein ligase RMA n=1 Tax=Kalanchoe fedtschenkoi TaxID=63787 RepID=A0A7N0T8X3_KALFE